MQEERWRYYVDEGRASAPQFGPPAPGFAFSVSSRLNYMSSDSFASERESSYFGLGCPAPAPTNDEESATSICSLCAAKFGTDATDRARGAEFEATSETSGRDTLNFFSPVGSSSCPYSSALLPCSNAYPFPSPRHHRPEKAK